MIKLIFLDIDGVLNNGAMHHSKEWHNIINDIKTSHGRLSSINIKNLNKLTTDTGAKIVISSTWRILEDLSTLSKILYDAGVTGEIIGVTPELHQYTVRGNEIKKYLDDNYSGDGNVEPVNYVILDDDSDMLYWQKNQFFWCDPFCGLSPGVAYRAARFLNGVY